MHQEWISTICLHSTLPQASISTLFRFLNFLQRASHRKVSPATAVISAYFSHMYRVLRFIPAGSLGASGAICGMVAVVASAFPDSRFSIILLPQFTFSAENGLYGLVCLELVGLIAGWRLFDHAGHLAGLLIGM